MDLYNPIFGDSDYIYTPNELIVVVSALPNTFCEETHQIVKSLIRQVIELPDAVTIVD